MRDSGKIFLSIIFVVSIPMTKVTLLLMLLSGGYSFIKNTCVSIQTPPSRS
jgi:hypothetical protein